MEYIIAFIIGILILASQKHWINFGNKFNKIKTKSYVIYFLILNISFIILFIIIPSIILLYVLITFLIFQGFLLFCIKQAKMDALNQKNVKKSFKKTNKKKKMESETNFEKNLSFWQKYSKGLITLVFVYLYLFFQNKTSHSIKEIDIISNTIWQYLMLVGIFINYLITIMFTLVNNKFNYKYSNVMYALFIIFTLSFILDTIFAIIFKYNPSSLLNIFKNSNNLNIYTVLVGWLNTFSLYILLVFDFVIWKKFIKKVKNGQSKNIR